MQPSGNDSKSSALTILSSERPRNLSWVEAAGLLFGDWGTSRLYVLGLAFLFAGRTSFYLIVMMSFLILAVGWAYGQICRIYPDGGGVYTAARSKSRTLAVVGALLLFADYTVTASLSVLDAFHYFGLPVQKHAQLAEQEHDAQTRGHAAVLDAGDAIRTDEGDSKTIDLPSLPSNIVFPKSAGQIRYDAAAGQLLYDGTMSAAQRDSLLALSTDTAYQAAVKKLHRESQPEQLFAWDSPGLWAIIAIALIGLFNLLGPKHSGAFAIFAALGMIGITVLITVAAAFSGKVHLTEIHLSNPLHQSLGQSWVAFVSIVLALSGVEAIANLTGVMKKPVQRTAGKAIAVVALEVAVFNVILALFMLAIHPMDRRAHVNDMLAYLAHFYVGASGEWPVRIVGGLLLLSAGNTAINGLMSILYVVSRDEEIPSIFQRINRFGAPWVAGVVATAVPIIVLFVSHDIESLAALYAIGVIGAVAINVTLCSMHPRLRKMRRKVPMMALGVLLLVIWVTLAYVKREALLFVTIVMAIGMTARAITKWAQTRKGPRVSLIRQAIQDQLSIDALSMPRVLVGTYGSDALAQASLLEARLQNAALVVCFIRNVNLSYGFEGRLNIDSDLAAQRTFARYLTLGHRMGVPVIPFYDTGPNASELLAECAALNGAQAVLIGTSRQGPIVHLIKGRFQELLEELLPPEIPVKVIDPQVDPSLLQPSDTNAAVHR